MTNAVQENNAIIREIERAVNEPRPRVVSSAEVWHWPEWKALAERLEVEHKGMTKLVLTLEVGKPATISVDRQIRKFE